MTSRATSSVEVVQRDTWTRRIPNLTVRRVAAVEKFESSTGSVDAVTTPLGVLSDRTECCDRRVGKALTCLLFRYVDDLFGDLGWRSPLPFRAERGRSWKTRTSTSGFLEARKSKSTKLKLVGTSFLSSISRKRCSLQALPASRGYPLPLTGEMQ